MAGTTGLEPATSDVTGRRSNQLNYVPAWEQRFQTIVARRRLREGAQARRSPAYLGSADSTDRRASACRLA